MKMVSVFDTVAQCFGRPAFVRTLGEASRSFSDEVNRKSPDNALSVHPDHFILYHVGDFDDADGIVTACVPPVIVCTGSSVSLGS